MQQPTLSLTSLHLGGEQKKEELEKRIKSMQTYSNSVKRFLNLSDQYGKSALHYASAKGHLEIVSLLLKHKAMPFIRDHKQRVKAKLIYIETI